MFFLKELPSRQMMEGYHARFTHMNLSALIFLGGGASLRSHVLPRFTRLPYRAFMIKR
jgi:hypothetical protein